METKVTFSELREVVEFINDNTNTESLHQKLKARLKETSYDDFVTFKDSYENDYLSISEWIHSDYFEEDGSLYSNDDYCITRDGEIERKENVNYCEYYDEYTTQPTEDCYIRRTCQQWCSDAIDENELYYYQGSYYDLDALAYNDLCEIDGSIYSQDDCYFYDGEWHTEPEQDDSGYVRDYHNSEYRSEFIKFSPNPEYFIGYEIEKEDLSVKESVTIGEFENKFPAWRKESDGSLDSESGYELISPAFELNIDEITKILKSDDLLVKHINAKFSDSCGGHINISRNGMSGMDFFRSIEGYTPLIYALYTNRLNTDYCKGKSTTALKNDNGKYQAVYIKNRYVEYRIFSAVPNVDTLIWRTKLLKAIIDNPTSCVKEGFLNANSVLKPILEEQYSTPERFQRLLNRLVRHTITYEGINPHDDSEDGEIV